MKFKEKLRVKASEFTDFLSERGIQSELIENSFREYSVKLSLQEKGKVNIYYSPKKDTYTMNLGELKDKTVADILEKYWHEMPKQIKDRPAKTYYHIYVDGSYYRDSTGYGLVILKDNEVEDELWGSVPENMVYNALNVSGELFAVRQAILWCKKHSVKEVEIFYDYKGVEYWATGKWKAKQTLTQEYSDFTRNSGIIIHWNKVSSHTGNRWNDRADELAKKGAGFSESVQNNNENSELGKYAEGFVSFLLTKGYDAHLRGIHNSNCAQIQISEAEVSIGYLNIYTTKKEPYVLRYHELQSDEYKDPLEKLWNEYHYGERELPM